MLRALVLGLGAVVVGVAAQPSQATLPPYRATIAPLSGPQKKQLVGNFWRGNCPVPLKELRVLTFSHVRFDGKAAKGQLVVNRDVVLGLRKVFRILYRERFPIRHVRFSDFYGPDYLWPKETDITSSFVCREAVPNPCTGGAGTGSWSQHAYGRAIDLNPVENPYIGTSCGAVHDPKSKRFTDRSRHRKGMVTPAVVRAFRSIGWGWGGDWTGGTKDYQHFSATGG